MTTRAYSGLRELSEKVRTGARRFREEGVPDDLLVDVCERDGHVAAGVITACGHEFGGVSCGAGEESLSAAHVGDDAGGVHDDTSDVSVE